MWFADLWIDDISLANGKFPRTQEWAASILYHACATEIDSKGSLQVAISNLATRCSRHYGLEEPSKAKQFVDSVVRKLKHGGRLIVIVRHAGQLRVVTTTPAEDATKRCSSYANKVGIRCEITSMKRNDLRNMVESFNSTGQEYHALMHADLKWTDEIAKSVSEESIITSVQELESEMCIDAILGVSRPLRSGIREEVEKLRELDVKVVLLSSKPATSNRLISAAMKSGILQLDQGDSIVEAPDFRKYTSTRCNLPRIAVVGSAESTDKEVCQMLFAELGSELRIYEYELSSK